MALSLQPSQQQHPPRAKLLLTLFLLFSLIPVHTTAQTYSGTFSGAFQVTVPQNPGSAAVAAQCPSYASISCTNIGEPNWCCPSGNYCGYNQGSVGCCPSNQQCGYGNNGAGAGAGAYQPSSTYSQPVSTYYPPATTTQYYGGAGAGVVTFSGVASVDTVQQQQQPYQPQTQTQVQQQGAAAGQVGYCSTLFANGPGLPTERPGQCGTILILQGVGARSYGWDLERRIAAVVAGVGVAWTVGWGLLLL